MSDAWLPAAGTKITIDGTEIGDLDQYGTFGGQFQVIKHTPINDGETYKKSGSRDNGTMQLQGAYVPDDAGQVAALAAHNAKTVHAIVVELPNKPTDGSNGTQLSFNAIVTTFQWGLSGADNKATVSITLEVTGAITITAAA